MVRSYKIALVGNPNTGKTSLFNKLTGLHKKIGNYPGITVNRVSGKFYLDDGSEIELIDLPGAYSLHPTSQDEEVVLHELLMNPEGIEGVILVADVQNIKKNLLLLTQIQDLGYPVLLALNMCDEMKRKGIVIDVPALEHALGIPVMLVSAKKSKADGRREGKGKIHLMKERIPEMFGAKSRKYFGNYGIIEPEFSFLATRKPDEEIYMKWLRYTEWRNLSERETGISNNEEDYHFDEKKVKAALHKEVIKRYQDINAILRDIYHKEINAATGFTGRIDRILIHKVWGLWIFGLIMFLVFQAIFTWASYPMEQIDMFFSRLSEYVGVYLPENELTGLLQDGIIPGISGVMMFVPQIVLLFLFISLLEEMGYMSRIVFLLDKIMRPFGLSGKSVVPLLSGTACAVPAIMSARTIENHKERLITMLVTPLITCSARLPVYTIIIALIFPSRKIAGLINIQGLVLFGLYFIGFIASLLVAWVLSKKIQSPYKRFFILEMPEYKLPIVRNVLINIWDNVKSFVFGAGKIIVAFSIILWFMATHGNEEFNHIQTREDKMYGHMATGDLESYKLEHSYLGIMGKAIEPAIRPLGYDWKIGIALLTSFAAREVFVSTLSTIYSVRDKDKKGLSIRQKLLEETHPDTGEKVFNFPMGISLLLFYAFAMQCFSTLATLKVQTGSWKWPLVLFVVMTGTAYLSALSAYQILS